MKYCFKPHELLKKLEPCDMGLEFTSVQRIELENNITIYSQNEELCIVCLSGKVIYKCHDRQGKAQTKDMLYIPCDAVINLTASNKTVLMRFGAPAELKSVFAHIRFCEVNNNTKKHHVYGKKETNCLRHVWNYIDESFNSSRFLIGICEGDNGGWTAWPPHEHSMKREEVYVYFDMGDAFGIQCVYEDMDNPYVVAMVRDGDLVSVPGGYHPSVGCPAGKISYVYCMVSKEPGDRSFMDLNIQHVYGNIFE